ncbi:hypothetical protein SmJEL517_g03240 [Synchytrium microbalum]|uniref:Nitrate reductase [NADPH] n=1 Tax=Synchytrium microbalum TaxID=1806994 RepID=A0A507C3G4_9FUNG|nr:uncharacterized protein SmJEL517_g03240 [Synchytrium microbalum]TPX34001.1 hypothetical protein SmJEL517_g03240 [Synchytrium microbalum]
MPLKLVDSGVSIESKGHLEEEPCATADDDEIVHIYPKEIVVDTIDPRDTPTPDAWVPRAKELVRLTGRHPFNCEAPLPLLMKQGWLTPVAYHFVRNHGYCPKVDQVSHRLTIEGLVERPQSFTMTEIMDMPHEEFPVLLVCAGNRRKEQNAVKQSIGFNWGAAGLSNSIWKGVQLRELLTHVGVNLKKAKYVCFEGVEDLPKGKYGTSISIDTAMDPRCDVLVAYQMNGKSLAPDHGFPIRMIIPGHIGGRMVKWLSRITVTSKESDLYYHYFDNRVLPTVVTSSEVADKEEWWYKEEYIINELNVNSCISSPSHDEVLQLPAKEPYTMKGYSYTGGGRKVSRIEISLDQGGSWKLATILPYPQQYIRRGKYWSWFHWEYVVEDASVLKCKELWVRAWDGQSPQPEKMTWNLMGMMNNCYFRIRVHHLANGSIRFEHPTLPGAQSGGWMYSSHVDTNSVVLSSPKFKPVTANGLLSPMMRATGALAPSPLLKAMNGPEIKEIVELVPSKPLAKYTMKQVAEHKTSDDCWFVHSGKVYDATPFMTAHPGGADSILIVAGTDCTEEFDDIHSKKAHVMLKDYLIGELVVDDVAEYLDKVTTFNPRTYTPYLKLVKKDILNHDTRIFRFQFSDTDMMGMPTGKHVMLKIPSQDGESKNVIRAYTPISTSSHVGYMDILIKIYFKDENHPTGGRFTSALEQLKIGTTIDAKGPLGHIEYLDGSGNEFLLPSSASSHDHVVTKVKHVTMLAAGTGITPMYNVLQQMLPDLDKLAAKDAPKIQLLYSNRNEDDILLYKELEAMVKRYPTRFSIYYTLSGIKPSNWKHGKGRIDKKMMEDYIPRAKKGSVAFLCGPDGMVDTCKTLLKDLEFHEDWIFEF